MFDLIIQKLQQLQGRVQAGPVGKFFKWWLAELKLAMPESWQEKLEHALRRVTVQLGEGELRVGVDENRKLTTLQAFQISQDSALQQQQVDDLLGNHDLAETPRYLLLERRAVLSKKISLPLAAEANLAQVLSFEMDRQTPFNASSVFFDWRVIDRDQSEGKIHIELFVVPRPEVQQSLEALQGTGFSISGVDITDEGNTLGLNLLPNALRARSVNVKGRLNWALGAAALVLLALVMAQSLYLRAHQVVELEEAIAEVQGEARQVMRIKEQIKDVSEAAGFLAMRRAESPLAIELVADVTSILPDDTYLDRLVIGKDTVQLQGKSQNAQRLIERVNESALLDDASFRGSTRLDARTGLEIFEVNARVTPGGGG
jgi:general secretion pathway protein L